MKDYLIKSFAYNNTIRVFVANTTNLVSEAQIKHQTQPTATQALGRVLTASVILGSFYEKGQTIAATIDGNGPLGKIIAESDAEGNVRGFVSNPNVIIINSKSNTSNLSIAVGTDGFLHLTKDLGIKNMFTGRAQLQTGEIAEDFAYYLAASEQIPSAVNLSVTVNEDGTVKHAGGYIIQVTPGYDEDDIKKIEKKVKSIPSLNDLFELGKTPEEISSMLTSGTAKILDKLNLQFICNCSKERFERGLLTLPITDLKELATDKKVDVTCHFCNKNYLFTEEEINILINEKENYKN